jgi:predicted metal-dependent phosphoesterase TrpH
MLVLDCFKLSAQDTSALKEVWKNLQPDSCPYKYNFHLHTVYSDGQMTPEGLIKQAMAIGLQGLAITDHHSVRGFYIAQSVLSEAQKQQPSQPLPHLWTGIEITSKLIGTEVHILGYGFQSDHQAMNPYIQGVAPQNYQAQASQVIDAIHQAGGLAVLAHPERYRYPAEVLIPAIAELNIDGVEAYYAYGNPKPWTCSPKQTQTVKELAALYGLFTTCGTDSHGLTIFERL